MSIAVPESKPATAMPARPRDVALQYLRHDQLQPSPLNPRKHPRTDAELNELADSIADKGILQNLVVRPGVGGKFEIAAGEGRWRAVGFLVKRPVTISTHWPADRGLPVIVRELTDEQLIEIGLIENLQRNDLHPLDEGRAYRDLYDLALKRGGKSAAANAVRDLAERMHKTPRFVQKRIALARDLAPAAAKLFETGRIDLAAAQLLAAAPAKDQARLVKQGEKTKPGDDDDIDFEDRDELSAEELAYNVTRNLRPLKDAIFDTKLYSGETVEHRGRVFARDVKAYDSLQRAAADKLTAELKAKETRGEIAFFEQGNEFNSWKYEENEKKNPKGGVFLERERNGRIVLHRGLKKRPGVHSSYSVSYDSPEYKERQKARDRQKAREKARLILDPRLKTVFAQVAKSPRIALAITLYFSLAEIDHQAKFNDLFQNRNGGRLTVYNWNDDEDAGLKVLRSAGSVPKGEAMLEWLLKQSLTTLAGAWAAMAATDFVDEIKLIKEPAPDIAALFEACDAKLDPAWLAKETAAAKARLDALDTKKKAKPKEKAKPAPTAKKKGDGK